jgi:transcriptional regulator with GAF, ATPase, and Fis domain
MPTLDAPHARLHITKPLTTLGASDACDLRLQGEGVAAHHALISMREGHLHITPTDPAARLTVNGKRVKRHLLAHGDLVSIGSHELRYNIFGELSRGAEGEAHRKDDLELAAYERLVHFSEQLANQGHTEELFEVLIEEVVGLTGADHGVLLSVRGGEHTIRAACSAHEGEEPPPPSESVLRRVLERREALWVPNIHDSEELNASASVTHLRLCSVLCAPLMYQRELLGLIYVAARCAERSFDARTLKVLQMFSTQAALLLKGALTREALQTDNRKLRDKLEVRRFGSLIGSSRAMQAVFEKLDRLAVSDASVLIMGETGTGKELIARELHARSRRAAGPFVAINCGALPESLIESELFGHIKGAFTGATHDKEGCFRAAHGGTLFLDEVGEMPLTLQVKLLRAIQEREITPVGSSRVVPVNIRLLCATQIDLLDASERGLFRQDLYYRVSTITLSLPPLRARGDDVLMIARYMIQRFSERYETEPKALSEEATRAIRMHSWPGNIRELENRISQALILSDGPTLTATDLHLSREELSAPLLTLAEARERFTQDYIEHVLSLNGGNRTRAAQDLNVDPRTVFRILSRARSHDEGYIPFSHEGEEPQEVGGAARRGEG